MYSWKSDIFPFGCKDSVCFLFSSFWTLLQLGGTSSSPQNSVLIFSLLFSPVTGSFHLVTKSTIPSPGKWLPMQVSCQVFTRHRATLDLAFLCLFLSLGGQREKDLRFQFGSRGPLDLQCNTQQILAYQYSFHLGLGPNGQLIIKVFYFLLFFLSQFFLWSVSFHLIVRDSCGLGQDLGIYDRDGIQLKKPTIFITWSFIKNLPTPAIYNSSLINLEYKNEIEKKSGKNMKHQIFK